MATSVGVVGRDARVLGLIGSGHFLSHFYILTLPPVFPLLRAEFGVSYALLGLAMTGYGLIGGVLQAPVGFLVDRLGARWVLVAGLALNAAAIAAIGLADAYWHVLLLAVLAGIGNSVFHPADYAIIAGSISRRRLGKAYSLHTFAGFFGSGVAPMTMALLAALWDWRTAFVAVGLVGLAVAAAIAVQGAVLQGERAEARPADAGPAGPSGLRLLLTPAILCYFLFLIAFGLASGGLSAFLATTLVSLEIASLEWANNVLSAYLLAFSAGILAGGVLSDRYRRHSVVMATLLLTAAGLMLLQVASGFGGLPVLLLFGAVGFLMGAILPARDMVVRDITPPGSSGKVFGFVFVGLSIGSASSPLLFGWVIDLGAPLMVPVLVALFLVLSVGASTAAGLVTARRPAT